MEVKRVVLHATVREGNARFVGDLQKENFEVLENGVRQEIISFSREDLPVATGILVDNSRSMLNKAGEVVAAAKSFVRASNPKDEIFVLHFNEQLSYGLPGDVPFTSDPTLLGQALDRIQLDGRTALYDAILAAKAARQPVGQWVMVQGGWTPRQFADAPTSDGATVASPAFTLEELDRAAPKNPLFVQEGYNAVYCNTLALKAVGLDPAGGARRPAAGLASFTPPYALYDAMPKASPAQLEQNLTDYLQELNRSGLTGVYSLGQSDTLAARAAKGPLPVRLWETLNFNASDPASAAKAAILIERSKPNQFNGFFGTFGLGEVLYGPFFDLAPRKEPWSAEIMS